MMLEQIVHSVQEPTIENPLEVEGKIAIYKNMQNLRFKNRVGEEIVRKRRRYAIEGEATGDYPLDLETGLREIWWLFAFDDLSANFFWWM